MGWLDILKLFLVICLNYHVCQHSSLLFKYLTCSLCFAVSGQQTVGHSPIVGYLTFFIEPSNASVMGRMVCKSYSHAPVAWVKM